jgi:molybdate transport system substrate-binding protein
MLPGGHIVPRLVVCLIALLTAVALTPGATATDVKVMISAGFFNVYKELGPAFETSTGHKLVTTRGPSIGDSPEAIPTRLARGEAADVVIMDGVGVDLLEKRDLARPGSRMPLAESFIGMVVRSGQPKPDISTMDALRKTLLAAKSIAYSDSSSGTYLATIGFRKLGVADEISGKTRKVPGPPSGEPVAAVVARGEAEIGFQQVAELMHVPGVDFVGTVPSDIQPPTLFVGAVPKTSQNPEAAIALLNFLSSADAAAVITKAGLKPLPAH